ncbi:hypothetical protein [Amaricoccus solimangrovi]|uniref:DUF3618 domain-containing protein n=1 Tax=Amaricoccus solimangrovi TaxID=2589815 RepID=A0A501WXI3_9RHOB|nr:hypothetical protein [Amaricoccus solimangrovi]TPE51671.1 hypothetical protein FJM51_08205 [Amaricoccus solimangrovi]
MNQDQPAMTGRPTTAGEELGQKVREAKSVAGESLAEARDAARSGLEDAKAAVEDQARQASSSVADEIARTAEGLDAAAEKLGDSPLQRDFMRSAAGGLRNVSESLRDKSLGSMVGDLSEFGRRNPTAFLGVAALAGFAMARFARASAPTPTRSPYSAPAPTPSPTTPSHASPPPKPSVTPGASGVGSAADSVVSPGGATNA